MNHIVIKEEGIDSDIVDKNLEPLPTQCRDDQDRQIVTTKLVDEVTVKEEIDIGPTEFLPQYLSPGNAVLSNALINFCMETKVIITQKYLEKGHTQMECDSMHSVIEKALKHRKINVPADYAYVAKTACKKNPYDVTYLYHYFFKDIEHTLNFYKSIRPGKKVGDPTVTDLRTLRYLPGGTILYKLRHSDTDWSKLPTRVKKFQSIPFENIPQLYTARLQIKEEKFKHLQELKNTMEKDYHNFYDNLPHF